MNKKVLVIHKDPAVRNSIIKFFRSRGFEANGAKDENDAMNKIGRCAGIGFIFCGDNITGMDTFRFIEKVRGIRSCKKVSIIIISGNNSPEKIGEFFEKGIDGLLSKHFSQQDLAGLLKITG